MLGIPSSTISSSNWPKWLFCSIRLIFFFSASPVFSIARFCQWLWCRLPDKGCKAFDWINTVRSCLFNCARRIRSCKSINGACNLASSIRCTLSRCKPRIKQKPNRMNTYKLHKGDYAWFLTCLLPTSLLSVYQTYLRPKFGVGNSLIIITLAMKPVFDGNLRYVFLQASRTFFNLPGPSKQLTNPSF